MKQILNRTALFFLGNLALRSIGLILLPVYTRYLSPEEYGIWALSNSVGLFLNLIMPLGMLMAVGRFYFDARSESERAESLGTIFIFLAIFPLATVLLLEKIGTHLFAYITPGVPYVPYMHLTTWGTYFSMFAIIPLMVLRSREQAGRYLLFSLGQAVLFHAVAISLVVLGRQGVLGMFWGNLFASVTFALVYIIQTVRWYPPRFSLSRLTTVFRYSLPLVVNGLAGWILMLSDRLILQRWIPMADVGIYSLGYTIGMIVQNAAEAATNAWFPTFYASRNGVGNAQQATDVVTYIFLGITILALLLTVGFHHGIGWFLPEAYRNAEKVVIWVALSGIFLQVYYILSYSIHYLKKTEYIAVISWSAVLVNLPINFLLIPNYGYIVAAISTLVSYAVMAGAAYYVSKRLYPVGYQFNRWWVLIFSTIVFCVMSSFRPLLQMKYDMIYSGVILAGWPLVLYALGFFSKSDLEFFKNRIRAFRNLILLER